MTPKIEISNTPDKDIHNYVAKQVRAHKYETGSQHFDEDGNPKDEEPLNVYLRDDAGNLIGAVKGWTFFGAYSINWMWVHEDYRHQGYAREMLKQSFAVAKERGCTFAYGDTWEIQGAYTLYEKLGAEVIMRMEDFPPKSALTRYRFDLTNLTF